MADFRGLQGELGDLGYGKLSQFEKSIILTYMVTKYVLQSRLVIR